MAPRVDNHDRYGRTINYLRLSVTDRCNLRCRYCMPADGVTSCGHEQILRYEELLLIAQAAACLGIEKIRVTGGEPLVRKSLIPFLARLNSIEGIQEVSLTTNGVLLQQMAEQIKSAGVNRINVSLDSLQPNIYREITRGGELNQVLRGLDCAERSGLRIKLNMVVMRGVNDREIEDFARLSLERPWSIRYIEYMPTMKEEGWQQKIMSGAEVLARLQETFVVESLARERRCGPARPYQIQGASGTLGIITPISDHFCGSCNRIRVTSRGLAMGCLLSTEAVDLRPSLTSHDMDGLSDALRRVVQTKGENPHYMEDLETRSKFSMATIGG